LYHFQLGYFDKKLLPKEVQWSRQIKDLMADETSQTGFQLTA